MWLHLYNMIGKQFFSVDIGETKLEDYFSMIESKGYEQIAHDISKGAGSFSFGPLPGLYMVTHNEAYPEMSEFEASRLWEDLQKRHVLQKA